MNVLLSSVGRRSYLVRYFRNALAGRGIVVATNSFADATGMLAADRAVVVPEAGKDGFIERLLEVCRGYDVRLLFSLHDWEAPFIAQASDRLRRLGVVPVISDPAVLDTCLDKYATFRFGLSAGIRVPRTALGLEEALQGLERGFFRFPLIVKPRRGQGSIGIETVHDEDELRCACLLAGRKVARMESNELLVKPGEESLVVQELVRGTEYGLDVVNDLDGRHVACLVKRKLAMRSGETDIAETVDSPELESFGRRIGERLGHVGMLDVDVMMDADGPCLLEANPRFGGHYPFSHEAGADIPAAFVAWAEGKRPDPGWLRAEPGTRHFKDISLERQA